MMTVDSFIALVLILIDCTYLCLTYTHEAHLTSIVEADTTFAAYVSDSIVPFILITD
jgi:hypothetical protein